MLSFAILITKVIRWYVRQTLTQVLG